MGLLRNPPGQDEGGVFFSKPSKRKFWEGSGKNIIQENIVWTENINWWRYVLNFWGFSKWNFVWLIKEKIVFYA